VAWHDLSYYLFCSIKWLGVLLARLGHTIEVCFDNCQQKEWVDLYLHMANEDKNILGETFSSRRKELNLSLKEVENATSIRMSYLQAIENGEFQKMNSPVYAQGFLRQYASFLGIDGDKIIRDHPELFSRPEAQDFAYGIGTMEVRGNPGAGVKWLPNSVWIFAFLLLSIAAWFTARSLGVI
jgi:transcriptional regulator with XRE-family HTH domain